MARKKIGLQVDGFEDYMSKLDQLGGTSVMKRAVEQALIASKKHVNPQIDKLMVKSNMPAKKSKKGAGAYWTGDTKDSLDTEMSVEWTGLTAEIKVGFDFKKSGMKSIFLIYGTPRTDPVKGLKNAIYGSKTQKEIGQIQAEELTKVIKEIMEGE